MLNYLLETVVRATMPILPYDEAAADWHAQQIVRLQPKGITPPFVDTQIAAIAYTHQLILVTRNVDDFRYLEDITVENWFSI